MEEMKKKKKKKKKMRYDYCIRNNQMIQLYSVVGNGWISIVAGWLDLTSTFGKAAEIMP